MYKKERFEAYLPMEEMIKKYYDFDTTFGKCSQCSGFEGTWSCPGFDFDPLGYWKQFSALRLIVDRISNEGCATVEEAQQRLFDEKKKYGIICCSAVKIPRQLYYAQSTTGGRLGVRQCQM